MESVAERLIYLRCSHNLTRKEVYEFLGYSRTTYSRWENGTRVPDNEKLLKFAQFYKVSPAYIFGFGYLQDEAEFFRENLEFISKNGDPEGIRAKATLEFVSSFTLQ